ncbi:MAG: hypothetical protein WBL85_07895 [Sedimentisphaerales bacterium]
MSEETKSQSPAPVLRETSKCKYCKQEILPKSSKCHHCGEYQNWWRLFVFLPLIMLIIATVQVLEAHKKYVDASDALRIVNSLSEDVNKASVEAKRMVTEIKNILDGTEKKVAELDRSIQDGNRAVMELRLLTRFDTVVINAQTDDRDAYDQLFVWGEDASFPYHEIAIQTVNKMMFESGLFFPPNFTRIDVDIPWSEGIDPNKRTLSQLLDFYNISTARIRLGVVQFVWLQRLDISRKERLQFLIDVLKYEKSLLVCKFAGYYFLKDTGDGISPLGMKKHLEWWEKNKETVK